jgi:DNA topoisomerase IA
VRSGRALFRATGKTVEFAGFLRAYAAGEDAESELGGQEKLLPKLAAEESLTTAKPRRWNARRSPRSATPKAA